MSYTVARRYLNDGSLPPYDAVRVEEFVNAFVEAFGVEPINFRRVHAKRTVHKDGDSGQLPGQDVRVRFTESDDEDGVWLYEKGEKE